MKTKAELELDLAIAEKLDECHKVMAENDIALIKYKQTKDANATNNVKREFWKTVATA